jgi:hypothetical protein
LEEVIKDIRQSNNHQVSKEKNAEPIGTLFLQEILAWKFTWVLITKLLTEIHMKIHYYYSIRNKKHGSSTLLNSGSKILKYQASAISDAISKKLVAQLRQILQ